MKDVRMNHIAGPADFAAAFEVSRETLARLELYADMLQRWQKTINLVSPATLPEMWHRHFADSAQLLALARARPVSWLDLGSGGGFPGLVIGILLAERPGSRLTLVESDSRKCAFLREVARQTALSAVVAVDIVADRIENVANTTRIGSVDVISARALAPLDRLLGWCAPFFGTDSVALLPKGRGFQRELVEARANWNFDDTLVTSRVDADSYIVVVRRLRSANIGTTVAS